MTFKDEELEIVREALEVLLDQYECSIEDVKDLIEFNKEEDVKQAFKEDLKDIRKTKRKIEKMLKSIDN